MDYLFREAVVAKPSTGALNPPNLAAIAKILFCFGILFFCLHAGGAKGDTTPGLSSKVIAAGCGPKQPIEWRITNTDGDVEVISKLVASAKTRVLASSSGPEPCEQLLVGWIHDQAKSESFIQSLRDLVSYLIMTPGPPSSAGAPAHKFPPFMVGAPGSTRRAVITALEDALIAHDTPVAQAALLFFTELDDSAVAAKARSSSRAKLKLFPWLIHPEWGSWIVNGLRSGEREVWQKGYPENARASIADFVIQAPYELPYGFPSLAKLSQFTNSPEANPSDDQALLADKNMWDAVYSIADAGMLIAGRPDLVAERKKNRGQAIHSLRMLVLGPETTSPDMSELIWLAAKVIDQKNGLGAATQSFETRSRLTNTATLLTRLELERRAMVLLALLTAKKNGIGVSATTDLVGTDLELDRISQGKYPGVVETVLADTFDKAAIIKNNSKYDAAAKSCDLEKIELVGRKVSFDAGMFEEEFNLVCHDKRQFSYQYVDTIPAGYAAAWRRHPRLFDFLRTSITSGIADETSWRLRAPDLDLVRGVPQLAVPMLQVAIRKPEIPWQYLREYMLLEYQPSFGWLSHVDAPPALLNAIVSGTNVAPSKALYDDAHDFIIGRMTTFLNYVARRPVVNALMPIALKMDDKVHVCHSVSGGFSCGDEQNKTKQQLLSALHALDADAKAAERALQVKYMFSIDVSRCKGGARPGTTRIGILFNPDLTKYLVRYQWNDAATSELCDFGFERQVTLTLELTDVLKQAFLQDDSVLGKFNLDIAATGTDTGYRTAVAIRNAAHLKENYATAEQLLHATGLYPLYKNFFDFHPNDTNYYFTSYNTLANAVKRPALRDQFVDTVEGLSYDAEFQLFDYFFKQFQPKDLRFTDAASADVPMIQPFELDPRILGGVIALNDQLVNQALQMAQGQIDATIGKLNAQADNWSVGISIGTNGFNPFGMLQFSFNGVGGGIGFSMPDLAITSITPAWGGIRIPITIPHSGGNAGAMLLASNVVAGTPAPGGGPTDLPGTSIAIPWTAAPPVSWGPGEPDTSSTANKLFFVGLLNRARPALTDADVQKVLDGLKLPVFPAKLADFLFAKSYEGFEMHKIADGEWYPTAINLQLLPEKTHGQPCPASGCIDPNNPQELAKYIADFNKSEGLRFDAERAAAQKASGDNHAFASDIPAVRLTYGPGFNVMMTEYSWPAKKDGHLITMRSLQETPIFVIDKIRANPSGHEFEKWVVAITDGFAIPVDVSEPTLKKAKAAFIEELGDELKALQGVATDQLFQAFSKKLEEAWKEFWSELKAHGEREVGAGSKDAFVEPFVPPPLSTPILRFFDPPWQHAFENGMTMEDWLIYERSTEFYKRIGRGGIPIGPRQ